MARGQQPRHRRPHRALVVKANRHKLIEQRTKMGLSLREVAYRMHQPGAYAFIGRLERGQADGCTPEFARAYLRALNVPPHKWGTVFVVARPHTAGNSVTQRFRVAA